MEHSKKLVNKLKEAATQKMAVTSPPTSTKAGLEDWGRPSGGAGTASPECTAMAGTGSQASVSLEHRSRFRAQHCHFPPQDQEHKAEQKANKISQRCKKG